MFEKEVRRTMNKEYIDRAFNKFKNDIKDIALNPKLKDSYTSNLLIAPAFKWKEAMAEERLAVCSTCNVYLSLTLNL